MGDLKPKNNLAGFDLDKQLEYLNSSEVKPYSQGIETKEYFGAAAPDYGTSKYDISNNTPWEDIQTGDYKYLRGERQSNLEKWGVGIGKAIAKTGVRTINGIVSPLYGGIEALATWDMSKVWDNEVNNLSLQAEQAIDEEMSIHSTKAAANAKGLAKLAYVNTWANDVLDGISYSASAMLSGAAYGKLLGAASKLASKGMGSVAESAKVLEELKDVKDQIKYVTELESKAKRLKDGMYNGTLAYIGASTEASANALNDANEWERQMVEKLSMNPDGSKRQVTEGELDYIKQLRKSVGNSSYALNIPVIMLDNWITFGKAMAGNVATEKTLKELAERTVKDAATDTYKRAEIGGLRKAFEATYAPRQILGKAIPEGIQEWEQYVVSKGTEDYYNKKYFNPDSTDFMTSMAKGINDAMSNEGLENFMIGAISGGIFGNVTQLKTEGLKSYKNPYNDIALNSAIDYLNSIKGKDAYKASVETAHRHANLSEEMDDALKNNNDFEVHNKRSDIMINYLTHMINAGKIEDVRSELQSFNKLSAEEFENVLGIKLPIDQQTKLKQTVTDYVHNKIKSLDRINALSESIDNQFPGLSRNMKDRFMYVSWTLEDANDRVNKLQNDLTGNLSIHNNVALHTRDLYKNLTVQEKEEAKKRIYEDATLNPLLKKELMLKMQDIDNLLERRHKFTLEFSALVNPNIANILNSVDEINSEKANTIIKQETERKEQQNEDEKNYAGKLPEEIKIEYDTKIAQALNSQDDREVLNIAKELNTNTHFSKLLDKEVIDLITNHYNTIKAKSVRTRQLNKKLEYAINKRDNLLAGLFAAQKDISEKNNQADSILQDYYNGNTKLSQSKLDKIIDGLTKDIDSLEEHVNYLEEELKKADDEIVEIEQRLESTDASTIEGVNQDLEVKKKELEWINGEIDNTKKSISKLRKLLNDLIKVFNSLFPNAQEDLDRYNKANSANKWDVVKANEEVEDKKLTTNQAINKLKTTLKELELERQDILQSIKDLNTEIADYEKVLSSGNIENAFEVLDVIPEPLLDSQDAYEVNNKAIKKYDPNAKKDITYAFSSTAGNNMAGNTDELTKDESQKRWFKVTSKLSVNANSEYTLQAITPTSNPHGNNVSFYDNNTILLVLHKEGQPVYEDGNLVYTSMRLPIEGKNDTEVLTKIKDKFTNKKDFSDNQILEINEALKNLRESIFKSNTPISLKVTGKTPGIYIKDNTVNPDGTHIFRLPVLGRIVENEKDIDNIDVKVVTESTIAHQGNIIEGLNPGTVLIFHEGQPLQARVAQLSQIPGAVEKVISLIKELKTVSSPEYKGAKTPKEIFDEINKITLFGNYDNGSAFKIFFKKDGGLVIGEEVIYDLNNPKIAEFLGKKYIRVSKNLLEGNAEKGIVANAPFKDPITGIKHLSYKHYLFSTNNRTTDSIPVGVGIVPLGGQQFYNVGLRYPLNITQSIVIQNTTAESIPLNKPSEIKYTSAIEVATAAINNTITIVEAKKILENMGQIDSGPYNMLLVLEGKPTGVVEEPEENTDENQELEAKVTLNKTTTPTDLETKNENEPTIDEIEAYRKKIAALPKDEDPNDTGLNKLYEEGVEPATEAQLLAEEAWFKKNLPQIPYEKVKSLIQGRAVGKFLKNGKVLISDRAPQGTTYHEAWHVVSQLFLTEQELEKLYQDYRDKVNNPNLTNLEVEEALADQFQAFMLGDTNFITPVQKTLFQRILDFIKNLLGLVDNGTIDNVFNNIKKGFYKNIKVTRNAKVDLYKSLPGKDSLWTRDLMESMSVYFFNRLFNPGKQGTELDSNISIDNIYNLKNTKSLLSLYDSVFLDIAKNGEKIKTVDPKLYSKLENDYVYIDLNKETIKREFERYLKRFGINIKIIHSRNNVIKDNGIYYKILEGKKHLMSKDDIKEYKRSLRKEDDENTDYNLEKEHYEQKIGEQERTTRDSSYIDSIQFSTKDGAPKAIKLLISSLGAVEKDSSDKYSFKLNRFLMPKAVNYNQTMNFLHNALAGVQTYSDMISRIESLSTFKPELKLILLRLGTSSKDLTPVGLSGSKFRLQRQFFQQFAKTKNTYYMTYIDEDGNIYSFDSNSNKHKDKIKDLWINNLKEEYNKPESLYTNENGNLIINKNRLRTLYADVNKNAKKADGTIDISSHIKFYKNIGINFSTDIFTEQEKERLVEGVTKIFNYVISAPNVTSLFQKGVINNTIEDLIQIEMGYNIDIVELSHINPEKKTVYGITLNTFLSLITNDMDKHLKRMEDNAYAKNSLWRKLLKENKTKLKLIVSEGLKPTDGDGELTSKLNKADLIMLHFNSLLANKFPYLRAGDKKLEYMFELDNFTVTKDTFYDTVLGYYEDELQRITDVTNGIGSDIQFYKDNARKSLIFEAITNITEKYKAGTDPKKFISTNRAALLKDIENYFFAKKREELKYELLNYKLITLKGPNEVIPKFINKNTLKNKVNNTEVLNAAEFNSLIDEVLMKQFISGVEQTKLFVGDLSLFKEGGDFSKRTGGATGPKKTTDVSITTNDWLNANRPRKDGKIYDGKINTIVYDDVISISEYYDSIAKVIGKDKARAYTEMEEGNAQGWITLDEYREFLDRSGEWTDEHETAYTKAIQGKELTKKEFQFFMPLKPQYFGPQQYNGLNVTTFYKLSLMPLIPSMVKGRQLEDLYNIMVKNKIGIATFGTATKVGARLKNGKLTPFYTEDGKINKELPPVQVIDYSYLGIQVDIAPIEKTKVTIGTQMRKLILSNLFSFGSAKNITIGTDKNDNIIKKEGNQVLNEYNNTVNELTKLKREKLLKRLTLIENNDGSYSIGDIEVFKDILLEEAESRDVAYNIIDSIELALSSDSKILDATPSKIKLEQILYATIQRSVISQKVFGDMKVMGASSGFELETRKLNKISEEERKNIKWLSNTQTLKFYETINDGPKKGTTAKMQVLLPNWFKEIYENTSIEEIDRELLQLVGFRIPTQGMNSIDAIEVVGFLPKESGNLIITPTEIVAKSGADYDVDKLSLYFPNYIIINGKPVKIPTTEVGFKKLYDRVVQANKDAGKKHTESYEEFFLKNKEKMLENRLIEINTDLILAPENLEQLLTPNSVDNIKEAVKTIRTLVGENTKKTGTSMLDFIANINTAISFWSGKDGVGVAALHNTHHILSQIANLKLNPEFTRLNLPHNHDNGIISLAGEFDSTGSIRISEIISEFINAYVDVAKDPFIFDLNAGIQTANVWLYLIRAGVPVKHAALFMRQPIIWDYIKAQSINESTFNTTFNTSKSKNDLINSIIADGNYNFAGKEQIKATEGIMYTETDLNKFFYNAKKLKDKEKLSHVEEKEYKTAQLQILKDFLHYQDTAKHLADLQSAMANDTQGVGKNRNSARINAEKLNKHLGPESIFNVDAVKNMIQNSPLKEFNTTVQKSTKMFNELFITDNPKVRPLLDEIQLELEAADIEGTRLEEVMDIAENEFINYALQNISVENKQINNELEALFYGPNSLAIELNNIKKTGKGLANNLLIKELFALINNNRSINDNIKFFAKRTNAYELDALTDAYNELYNIAPVLADKLTKFAILQSGISNSPITYLNVIPADKFFNIANSVMSLIKLSDNIELSNFVDMFYENMYLNNTLVPKVKSKSSVILARNNDTLMLKHVNRTYVKIVEKDTSLTDEEFKEKLIKGENPYITTLYKRSTVQESGEGKIIMYTKAYTRGNGYKLKDYRNVVHKEEKIFNTTTSIKQQFSINKAEIKTVNFISNQILSTQINNSDPNSVLSPMLRIQIMSELASIYSDNLELLTKLSTVLGNVSYIKDLKSLDDIIKENNKPCNGGI